MKPVTTLLVCSLAANVAAVVVLVSRPEAGGPAGGARRAAGLPGSAGRPGFSGQGSGASGGARQGGASGASGDSGVLGIPGGSPDALVSGPPGSNAALIQAGGLAGWLEYSARVASADRNSLPDRLNEIAAMAPSKQRDELLSQLYRRWGEVSPKDALAAISDLPLPERQAREVDIVRGWALTDPAAAMDWMDNNPPPLSSTTVNPPNAARYQAMADALLAADRPDLLSEALAHASDDAHRSLLAVKLADYLARYDESAGVSWLLGLPPGAVRSNAAARFARTIAEDVPELALDLATKLPANAGRNAAITAVFRQWADSGDPAPAAAWLAQQKPTAAIDNALVAFLPVAAGKDGALAAGLLDRFVNPANRQRAVDQAATRIALVDPARAVDWVVSYSPESADRIKTLQPLVTAWVKSDPTAAASLVPVMTGLTPAERETLSAVVRPPVKK